MNTFDINIITELIEMKLNPPSRLPKPYVITWFISCFSIEGNDIFTNTMFSFSLSVDHWRSFDSNILAVSLLAEVNVVV